tara:strand:+ start:10918 stop:12099 length:1182 start_codon:yes stop_codon:yes gene_type:complete
MAMRKIAVVTGTRAEYGLLYWIIKGIHEDPDVELQLIVTGMHLSHEFGLTVNEIEKDGFPISERVEMLLSSDTEIAISTSMGLGMIGFANAYKRLMPNILVVLGDRFEILSAVSAAVPFNIPVAHIHGGESTEGSMDELFRHAITKMSFIHFPTVKVYADRIIQMGEDPQKVFCVGAPGIDNIFKLNLLNKSRIAQELNLPDKKDWGIITYHPETLEKDNAKTGIDEILSSINEFKNIFWIFTMPNADTEGRIITKSIEIYTKKNKCVGRLFPSLGQLNYLSVLQNSIVMVGNSSSGIIEAPSFKLPVVNIGDRQTGRIKANNILDVKECKKSLITDAIKRAISKDFRYSLEKLENPYGSDGASDKLVEILKVVSLSGSVKKQFHEISIGGLK